MPNYISNALVVTKGDPQTVWDQLAGTDILGRPTVFDLSRIIPVQNKSEQVWSEANTEAWGTKWVDEAEIVQQNRRLIFTSAWTCPYKVICKIIAMFPEHEFEFGCSDIQTGESFDWVGIKGKAKNFKETHTVILMDDVQQDIESLVTEFGGTFDVNGDVKFSATEDFEQLDNRVHQFLAELDSRNIHFN